MDGGGAYAFPTPAGWSKITLFAHQSTDFGGIAYQNAVRPPQDEIDAIFAGIVENEKNEHLVVHPEYLQLPGISPH
jgi:hypothetical protein